MGILEKLISFKEKSVLHMKIALQSRCDRSVVQESPA